MPDNNFGQFTPEEFSTITQVIVEMSDIGTALQDQNLDWFKGNQSLSTYYGGLVQRLIELQKRLSGGKSYRKE